MDRPRRPPAEHGDPFVHGAPPPPRLVRAVTRPALRLLLIAAVLAGTTGCIYFRLYQFRRQLADFDAHCAYRQDPGPVVTFHDPVLRPADVEWLMGLPVTEIRIDEAGRPRHVFRFRKCPGTHGGATQPEDLELVLVEHDGRVAEVRLPARLNVLMSRERLARAFRGADRGTLDRAERRTGWVLDDRLALPVLDDLLAGLGLPCSRDTTGASDVLTYRYAVDQPQPVDPPAEEADAEGVFIYDPIRKRIRRSWVRVGRLVVEVEGVPGESYHVDIRRTGEVPP